MLKIKLVGTMAQLYCDKIFELTGEVFELGVAEDSDFVGGSKITTRRYGLFHGTAQSEYNTLPEITIYLEGYLTGVINEARRLAKSCNRR